MNFPGSSGSKASVYNAGDLGLIPGSGRFPWRRKSQSTPLLLPGKSHGQRSLVSYSPWDSKDLDTTERLRDTYSVSSPSHLTQDSAQRRCLEFAVGWARVVIYGDTPC